MDDQKRAELTGKTTEELLDEIEAMTNRITAGYAEIAVTNRRTIEVMRCALDVIERHGCSAPKE